MSTDLLCEHFATLATAPDGIARLRELILQLAVQGKLGTQDEGDEPIKIRKSKGHISDSGSAPLSPFDIPKNWVWTTIPTLANSEGLFVDGDWIESKDQDPEGSIRLIQLSDIGEGNFRDRSNRYLTKERAIQLKCTFLEKEDILISRLGEPLGKSCIFPGDLKESITAVDICIVRVAPDKADNRLLVNFFNSLYFRDQIGSFKTGTTRMRISRSNLGLIQFPLPPLAEQHRIVAKVDRLMALCDELEARQQQERAGCLRLGSASLAGLQNATHPEEFEAQWAQVCDAFDLILDCPENVAVFRQTILQLAVQGRLSTKGDSVGWIKEPLENLVTKVTNGYVGPTRFIYVNSGIPYILSKHLKKHKIVFDDQTFISDEFNQKNRRSILQKGDVLLVQSGDIGNSAVVDDDHVGHNCHALIVMTPLKEKLNGHYLSIFFSSPEGRIKSIKIQTGMTLKHLNCRDVKRMIVPLPPLAEQHRIVAKVDSLMALCDALESRLKERAATQAKFTSPVVKQVAG